MADPRTFTSSAAAVQYLQGRFGTMLPQLQAVRKQWYSFLPYVEAGAAQFNFFTGVIGTGSPTLTQQLTNMQQASSFGVNYMLIVGIRLGLYIKTWNLADWAIANADSTTLTSDILFGFTQCGFLNLAVNAKNYLELPQPFMTCPPASGQTEVKSAGIQALTLTEGTPNVIATYASGAPYARLNPHIESFFAIEPGLFLEPQQNFQCQLSYPNGLVPVIGTGVTNDSTNPLYVGAILDGIMLRPVS